MKKRYTLSNLVFNRIVLLFVFTLISAHAFAQSAEEKQALKVAQAEAAVQKAKDNLIKAERKVTIADSLTDIGIQNQIEGKDELKQYENELKRYEKEYNSNSKALNKRMNTKDEVEFLVAQKEMKELDAQYKAFLKQNDIKAKSALKKEAKGAADQEKGKGQKKPAEEGLVKAQSSLEVAQAKLNMLTNTEIQKVEKSKKLTESKEDPDKKKKKKEKEKDMEE